MISICRQNFYSSQQYLAIYQKSLLPKTIALNLLFHISDLFIYLFSLNIDIFFILNLWQSKEENEEISQ